MARQLHCILTVNFSPWSAYSGGGQRSTHNLAVALVRRGHRVSVVYTKPPWETVDIPEPHHYPVKWAALPALRSRSGTPMRPLTAIGVARCVSDLLRASEPTVVHANGEEAWLLPRLRRARRFAFVVTPRYPSYPDEMQDGTWQESRYRRLQALFRYPRYSLLGPVLLGADLWCPTSHAAARAVARVFPLDPARLRVVPNGVSEEFSTARGPREPPEGPVRGVFFGRIAQEKGVHVLVEALKVAAPSLAEFTFIGRGPETAAVQRRIAELGLERWVRVEPWLDAPFLAERVRAAHFAVLPSLEESFGNTMAEAMALGVPVIATTAGSIPEVVVHGRTGLLVAPGDSRALGEAMIRLAHDSTLTRSLGEAGAQRARDAFSWDGAAAAFESHYFSLLP